jgi:hypothetical protein
MLRLLLWGFETYVLLVLNALYAVCTGTVRGLEFAQSCTVTYKSELGLRDGQYNSVRDCGSGNMLWRTSDLIQYASVQVNGARLRRE